MPQSTDSPEKQLASFLAKYSPQVASLAKALRKKMRQRYPTALELVYDNYNALAIGFGPSERASEAIFSIALYPKWVSLFFLQAKGLPDPGKKLQGSGNVARHIVLPSSLVLDEPDVCALMQEAAARAAVPFDPGGSHRLIIKSISAKQRPRRPPEPAHPSGSSKRKLPHISLHPPSPRLH
jgi:hypothetical protein